MRTVQSEVVLGKADGMPKECAINCDHLRTVAKNKLGSLVTMLSSGRLREVRTAIAFALALME